MSMGMTTASSASVGERVREILLGARHVTERRERAPLVEELLRLLALLHDGERLHAFAPGKTAPHTRRRAHKQSGGRLAT